MTFLRPEKQKEAEEIFALARIVVAARGDEFGTVRLTEALWIVSDETLLGKRESNTLIVSIADRTVMHAIYNDDDMRPLFITFHPDYGWKWTIRRAAAALDMEKQNAVA